MIIKIKGGHVMGRTEIGSYEGFVSAGQDLLETINENIYQVLGKRLSKKELRHVSILVEDDSMRFTINKFSFKPNAGILCTPLNGDGDMIRISEFIAETDGQVTISYVR